MSKQQSNNTETIPERPWKNIKQRLYSRKWLSKWRNIRSRNKDKKKRNKKILNARDKRYFTGGEQASKNNHLKPDPRWGSRSNPLISLIESEPILIDFG